MSIEGNGPDSEEHQPDREAILAEAEAKRQRQLAEQYTGSSDELRSDQLQGMEEERLAQLARLQQETTHQTPTDDEK